MVAAVSDKGGSGGSCCGGGDGDGCCGDPIIMGLSALPTY